jgi:hypothetical protein
MFRAIIELLFTIFVVVVARAILNSILKNFKKAARAPRPAEPPAPSAGGELHKDPVCGTYVAESSAVRRQIGGRTLFYCSEDCRKKDVLVHR